MPKVALKASGFLSLFLTTLVAACASTPVVLPPSIVRVPVVRYIQIPQADLNPCPVPVGSPALNGDLLLHDQAAMEDLKLCNQQMARARAKNGSTPPPTAATHPE